MVSTQKIVFSFTVVALVAALSVSGLPAVQGEIGRPSPFNPFSFFNNYMLQVHNDIQRMLEKMRQLTQQQTPPQTPPEQPQNDQPQAAAQTGNQAVTTDTLLVCNPPCANNKCCLQVTPGTQATCTSFVLSGRSCTSPGRTASGTYLGSQCPCIIGSYCLTGTGVASGGQTGACGFL